jgi:transposase
MTLRARERHEALQAARRQQETPEWKAEYAVRAGVERTLSQGVRGFGPRRCRYIGLSKARLQRATTVAAINVYRISDWLEASREWRRERCHSYGWWPDRNSPTISVADTVGEFPWTVAGPGFG